MSFVKTLAKVAVGVAIAKGVNEVAKSRAGKGSIFDELQRAGTRSSGGKGGLEGMLGNVLSGRSSSTAGGGIGGLLESLRGAAPRPTEAQAPRRGSLGNMLNQSFESYGEPETQPGAEDEKEAALLLRAMIMAAKADGRIDAAEKEKLTSHLEDASEEELAFVEENLQQPVDPQALAADTPSGREAQVYLMSLMAIDVDSPAEARYLRDLASALSLDAPTVEGIHKRLGLPKHGV